ncbi:hypothetical protein D1815_06765 [Aquimarina sp. AD1]|uniref:hypothetical protein n=1 Tax=Aquimarina sp. (strain AD1) TaxID=1714848 RepID=UPI000E4E0D17|nr:hypothetical protein [Aquimarina sp. AD1]AXT55473.1 hypothetical protein D1815_06765 [Aquimarina sp. AD1]RKN24624.1 hypothetical protein D7035_11075 [Aquimarina sp. AD1]
MRKVTPYRNKDEAIKTLDNGGRFYNILTKADDGVISQSELGKVSGLFSDKQKMILFLDLATSNLSDKDREEIIVALSNELRSVYDQYAIKRLLVNEVMEKGELSTNIVITGVPKRIASKSDFNGFIMVPIVAGKVTTFSMIPIVDTYDVYEITSDDSLDTFVIAHAKGGQRLPERKIKVAGVLKELKAQKDETDSKKYLEVIYYLDI